VARLVKLFFLFFFCPHRQFATKVQRGQGSRIRISHLSTTTTSNKNNNNEEALEGWRLLRLQHHPAKGYNPRGGRA